MGLIMWFTGSVGGESTEFKNYSWKMPIVESANLRDEFLLEEYCSMRMSMQYLGHHHHQHGFSTLPADSVELHTRYLSNSQPSSSSPPTSALSTSGAENTMTTKPPRFIDFLGVGAS